VDYFQNRGQAMIKLLWSSPSIARQVIPRGQLYSKLTATPADELERLYQAALFPQPEKLSGQGAPEGWLHADIGHVGVEGNAEIAKGEWLVHGSGADIWANGDSFHYLFKPWKGDGEFTARLISLQNTDPWAKAGLMIRESLGADARHATLALTPGHGLNLLYRSETAGETKLDEGPSASGPIWLRLVRKDNQLRAFWSKDGQAWEWVGTEEINLSAQALVGLAVCSHDNSAAASAVFENVQVIDRPGITTAPPATGAGNGLLGTYFDANTGAQVTRLDPTVDFDWDVNAPIEGIGPRLFTVRWEGALEAQFTEPYALHVVSDDGARLWLDGELLIDAWSDRGISQATARKDLVAGRRYRIRLEYYQRAGEAIARLLWSSPSTPKEPIPASQLYAPESAPVSRAAATAQAGNMARSSSAFEPATQLADTISRSQHTNKITGVSLISEQPGVKTAGQLGAWGVDGGVLYALDRRGYVEYELSLPTADMYQVEVEGFSHNRHDFDSLFYLLPSINGEPLGRKTLDAGPGKTGTVRILLPWLSAGTHTLRLYWDNARKGRSLAIHAVRLQSLQGPDTDGNDVKDWVEDWLKAECGVETPAPLSTQRLVIRSATSPVCLEGRGGFLSMMRIQTPEGTAISAQGAPGNRWFANVPLAPEASAPTPVSYQNGGRIEPVTLLWEPTDALKAADMTVRAGDALLLACIGGTSGHAPGGTAVIELNGKMVHSGPADAPFVCRFDQAGDFTIKASYSPTRGSAAGNTFVVKAVAASLGNDLCAWVGNGRNWNWSGPVSGVVLDPDPRLKLSPLPASAEGSQRFALRIDEAEPRSIAARLGNSGPILSTVRVNGFRLYSGAQTDFGVLRTYEDGTELIEMGVVLSPLLPPVTVELKLIVGGVIFEDGTVIRRLAGADFNALGEATVRFLRPALAKTSVCHTLSVWEGRDFLGAVR
jgi:regulation of enolase protein 1 (concanavalin A-like superfamily)